MAGAHVFLFERAEGSIETIIGSSKANESGQWAFEYPLKMNKTMYYVAKTEPTIGQSSVFLPSNEKMICKNHNRNCLNNAHYILIKKSPFG